MMLQPGSGSSLRKFDIYEKGISFIPEGAHGMVQVLELPPGDPGPGPHRHSGPLFGYMLEGEMLFELEGGKPCTIKAGEGFWEPGGEVVHYQASNMRDDITSRFVVFMLCPPGIPMTTFLDESEIAARSHLRYPHVHIEEYSRRMPPATSS